MELKDLKFGYIVEFREGSVGMVAKGQDRAIILSKDNTYIPLDYYNDDLKCTNSQKLDIMEVYGYNFYESYALEISTDDRELLWERKETKEMTVSQIEKELGYPIKIIKED